jgi:hypothetical protein
MQSTLKSLIHHLRTIFIVLAMSIFGCSCTTSKPTPDPLAGWNFCASQDPAKLDKAIRTDYEYYIQKLPQTERISHGPLNLFEDETGRHAVKFETGLNGTSWAHVLIYDKDNKRIKAIKYVSGHYSS